MATQQQHSRIFSIARLCSCTSLNVRAASHADDSISEDMWEVISDSPERDGLEANVNGMIQSLGPHHLNLFRCLSRARSQLCIISRCYHGFWSVGAI